MKIPTCLAAASLLGLSACATPGPDDFEPDDEDPTPADDDDHDGDDDDDDDDSAPPTGPCLELTDPTSTFGPVEAELSATVSTVMTVRWKPSLDEATWVWFGEDVDDIRTAPSEVWGSDGRTATLLGLTTETTYHYQVVTESPDGLLCTPPTSFTTGPLPQELPDLTIDVLDSAAAAGGYTTLILKADEGITDWLVILDGNGDYVWFRNIPGGAPRAWLSIDRKAVLTNDFIYDPDQDGKILRYPLDGSEPTQVPLEGAHQDFVEVESGIYASFGWDIREYDGGARLIAGETIVESIEGGGSRVVWSLFDDYEPDLNLDYHAQQSWATQAGLWAHLNHIHYAEDEDAYYVTSRYLSSAYRIDRATGHTSWMLSPIDGDFVPGGAQPILFNPHSAVPVDGGVLLFDTCSDASGGCSVISEFALDTEAWTAEPTWMYSAEDCPFCPYLGNAEQLWNGNRTLVLSVNGRVDEVSPDGELVWRMTTPQDWWLGYATRTDGIYR